ncbi:MAG: c-type cytochrome [Bacteroidetes bacterium]|nr:c-type cytochrome [Bacteroidota bacterium]
MKKIFLTLILMITVLYLRSQNVNNLLIPDEADQLVNPYTNDTKAPLRGARVYKKVCWTCHGDNGSGTGPQAAEIETKPANFKDPLVAGRSDGALFWWISNGGSDMQAFKDALTEDEIWDLVMYIRKVQND